MSLFEVSLISGQSEVKLAAPASSRYSQKGDRLVYEASLALAGPDAKRLPQSGIVVVRCRDYPEQRSDYALEAVTSHDDDRANIEAALPERKWVQLTSKRAKFAVQLRVVRLPPDQADREAAGDYRMYAPDRLVVQVEMPFVPARDSAGVHAAEAWTHSAKQQLIAI